MNMFARLGLVGMLLHEQTRNKISWDVNPELMNYLEVLGVQAITQHNLIKEIQIITAAIAREFDYFDASEMKVNEVLDQYLRDYAGTIKDGYVSTRRDTAMIICSLGNKGGAFEEDEGVEELLKISSYIIGELEQIEEGKVPDFSPDIYVAWANKLEKVHTVLSLLDVFLTSRLGMVMGVEEFAPLDYNYLNPVDPPDFVSGLECSSLEDCQCGCAFDHPLRILSGMEDFLNGVESDNSLYFQSVAKTNNIRLQAVAGQEGPVYEAIRELGTKAYEAVMAAWDSVRKWFSNTEDEANDTELKKTVENNKKAIQSMDSTNAVINQAAKNGITNLAERTDPTGGMSKIVAKLTTPASASLVLDGLLGHLATWKSSGGPLFDAKKAAEENLAALKKAASGANGNDDNKDAAKEAKALVQEKIKAARESVAAAKKLVSSHNKITSGIKKAINGITPHIFVVDKSAAAEDKSTEGKPQNDGKNKGKKK